MADIKLILVDTSAWIASMRPDSDTDLEIQKALTAAIVSGIVAIALVITLELLQGTRTQREYDDLKLMLQALHQLPMTPNLWERTFSLGFLLRRNGLTVPTMDIIIAALALEYDCALLHRDRHFPLLQSVVNLDIVELSTS